MGDWSWDITVPSSLERLLLVCLEDHCCDERWVPFKFADLQRLTGMSMNRIKQAVNTLWKLGRLEYRPSRAGKPQQFHILSGVVETGNGDPPFPNMGFTYPRGEAVDTPTSPTSTVRPYRDSATAVVKRWFATQEPRPTPAGGFPAAVKIVERFLSAGWELDHVERVLGEIPTLSYGTMEYALRRPTLQVNSPGLGAPAMPQSAPTFCPSCGSSGVIRTQSGRRCASCDHPLG